ncbi:hypothetical protein LINPERHAP1_LOCUS15126 [Linum perenne]
MASRSLPGSSNSKLCSRTRENSESNWYYVVYLQLGRRLSIYT